MIVSSHFRIMWRYY